MAEEKHEEPAAAVIEDEVEEATSPDLANGVLCEGYVEVRMKKKKQWRPYWLCLCGGSLFYYKNELDVKPNGVLQVGTGTDAKVETYKEEEKPFLVKIAVEKDIAFISTTKAERRDQWLSALQKATAMEATAAPPKNYTPLRKKTLAFRAKKSISSKFVGSNLGKSSVESIVLNEQVRGLLQAFRALVKAYSNKAKADWVEQAFIKVAVKTYLEWQRKAITTNDLMKLDAPLREAFNLLDKIYRHSSKKKAALLKDTFARVEKCFVEVELLLEELLRPLIRPKNIIMLKEVFAYVGNAEFMMSVWDLNLADATGHMDECLFNLVNAMSKYTQIELNVNKN
eukprot:TRINITY_DN17004_c0_g1_i1.p1 TRINITY_DN17004_c0_g1~~TRINITY_DN17004_c0_g1_i1.p1  ORF type:complete len:340 (+),score=124.91 TRINITY_DN17004_c0_g1_i1:59-1078(+)